MSGKRKPKKILITNIVTLNPGDAAILQGMIQIFRQKYGEDVEIIVFDKLADAASKYYPWASFRQSFFGNEQYGYISRKLKKLGYGHWVRRLRYWRLKFAGYLYLARIGWFSRLLVNRSDRESIRIYGDADLVVSTGGTYLIENYNLSSSIYDYLLTLSFKKPLIFFTQTLGPFDKEKNISVFREIFRKSNIIFLRDERSKKHLLEIGVSEDKIVIAKDSAFAIDANKLELIQDSERSKPLKIAISVRSLRFFESGKQGVYENYKKCIVSMIVLAVEEFDAEICFLSTCQGIPEYWTNDSALSEEIYEMLPSDIRKNVFVDGEFRQPLELIRAYKNFDLVIATRMHAAILSFVAGTPVLGIAYEFKLEELFDQLSMDKIRLSISNMSGESSAQLLKSIIENLDYWKDQVSKIQTSCRKEANSVIDRLPS